MLVSYTITIGTVPSKIYIKSLDCTSTSSSPTTIYIGYYLFWIRLAYICPLSTAYTRKAAAPAGTIGSDYLTYLYTLFISCVIVKLLRASTHQTGQGWARPARPHLQVLLVQNTVGTGGPSASCPLVGGNSWAGTSGPLPRITYPSKLSFSWPASVRTGMLSQHCL